MYGAGGIRIIELEISLKKRDFSYVQLPTKGEHTGLFFLYNCVLKVNTQDFSSVYLRAQGEHRTFLSI
jgi:hypothetical protein